MGYTTEFSGYFKVTPPLNEDEMNYLTKFANTRRMNRSGGEYFVDGNGFMGQDKGPDMIYDHNYPPPGQPGLWCKWIPTGCGDTWTPENNVLPKGHGLIWSGAEKFYDSVEWLKYLIEHFLDFDAKAQASSDPQFENFTFNHTVTGIVKAQGEDPDDTWTLHVKNNVVSVTQGHSPLDSPC